MIRSFSLAMAVLLALSAAAYGGVRDKLARPTVLRGTFEQSRHLQGFRNPLVSQGDFVVARDRGVLWETRKPFPSTTAITKDRVVTRQGDGSSQVVVDKSQSQAANMVNALMPALLGGDVETLSKYFTPKETDLPKGGWRLELSPRATGLAHVFARIVLQGDRYVRSVHLDEKGGDSTDIEFQSMTDAPAQLDAAEAKQFE
jgi:hypothetical protein